MNFDNEKYIHVFGAKKSQADWVIDLGPFAGENGGNVMFEGLPKDLIICNSSITGQYLKEYIK
jgi:excinuclease UvrABC ATPase subunit